jgi:hypothetical protein
MNVILFFLPNRAVTDLYHNGRYSRTEDNIF